MATALTEFERYVAADVIDCPELLVSSAVQRSIVEFCEKTGIFKHEFEVTLDSTLIDSTINNFYDVDLSAYTELKPVTVLEINIDGVEWTPAYMSLLSNLTEFTSLKSTSTKYFNFPDMSTIRLYDMQTYDSALFLKIIFTPVPTATSVDDALFNDWGESIIAGAKYRLLAMPGKAWTNEKAALHNNFIFRAGVAEASAKITRGYTRTSAYIKPSGLSMWGV